MITNLSIKNFKNVNNLHIKGFERLNLFTGKNNTGKSTLLEAILLYVNNGNPRIIRQLLFERGELLEYGGFPKMQSTRRTDVDILASLFSNRKVGYYFQKDAISFSQSLNNEDSKEIIKIGLVKYINEEIPSENGTITSKKFIKDEEPLNIYDSDIKLGLQITGSNHKALIYIGEYDLGNKLNNMGQGLDFTKQSCQFVKSGATHLTDSGYLWDQIALTEKEQYVIKALKIIEPDIQRITFVGETAKDRAPVVKLKHNEKVVPLKGMGDGINRILTIILAAVNSENGYLLIDEFENGLHFSVQEQLWAILLQLSDALNIQIFATTHNNDCIEGFEQALATSKTVSGKLFRLERKEAAIVEAVDFDLNEVKIATKANIEIR